MRHGLSDVIGGASWNKYHPELLACLKTIKAMGKACEECHGLTWHDLDAKGRESWLYILSDLLSHYGPTTGGYGAGAYSLPFLHPSCCDQLVAMSGRMSCEVNEEEAVHILDVAIPNGCPWLHSCLHRMFNSVVNPLTQVLYQLEQTKMHSIQLAQYNPSVVDTGKWQHDLSSDITLVVALNDDHEGGGTLIKPWGLGEPFEVPRLPKGHALLFQGSRTLHKGLPVTQGARRLLVFKSEIS